MKLMELELRLIAIDDGGTRSMIWRDSKWVEGTDILAGRAWADGAELSPEEAKAQFGVEKLPAL